MTIFIIIFLFIFFTFSAKINGNLFLMKKFTKYKPFNPVPTINTPDPTFPRPLRPKLLTTTLQTTESFTTLPSSTTTRLILSDVAKWSFKLRCNETYKKTLASKESQDYKDFVNVVYYRLMTACHEVLGNNTFSISKEWQLSKGSVAVSSFMDVLSTIDPSAAKTWNNALTKNLPNYINGSFEISKYTQPTQIPILPLAIGLGVGGGLLLVALVCGVTMFCIRRKRIIETEKLKRNAIESQHRSLPPSINGQLWTKSEGVLSLSNPNTIAVNDGFDDTTESIKKPQKFERNISNESIRDRTNIYGLKSNVYNGSFNRPMESPQLSNDVYMLPEINLKGSDYQFDNIKHFKNNTPNNQILDNISNAVAHNKKYNNNNLGAKKPMENAKEANSYVRIYEDKEEKEKVSNDLNFIDSGRSSDSMSNNSKTNKHKNNQTSNRTNSQQSRHEPEKFKSSYNHFNLVLPNKNDTHHQLMKNTSSSSSDYAEASHGNSVKSKDTTDRDLNEIFKPRFNASKIVSSVRSSMSKIWKNNKDSILYRKHC